MKYYIIISVLILLDFVCISQNKWEIIKTSISDDLHDIEFVNDSVGFVYTYGTGKIFKTTDSGKSWNLVKQTDSLYFEQIQFIDDKTGWICGEKGKVLKTTDCGNTWADISLTAADGNLLLYGMYFIDNLTGYLSGGLLKEQNIEPGFFLTDDGGLSWTIIHLDIPNMVLNLETGSSNLWGTGSGFIIKISAAEKSWEYSFKDTSKIIGQIRDIEFADDKFGLGVSFNGKVLSTVDGGNNWTFIEITTNRLRSIAYAGQNKWIIGGDDNAKDGSVLYVSTNNGEIWEKTNDFPDIHRVTLSKNYVWIAGKNGFIAKMKR